MIGLQEKHVVVLSRCARTLFNFRLALMLGLKSEGADVFCMGAGGDGFPARLKARNVDFRALPVSLKGVDPLGDLWLLLRYVWEFRALRPDIVHAFTIKSAVYGTIGAWLAGVPVRVVTITGLGHAFISANFLVRKLVTKLYRFALRRANLVYFQNPDDLDLFVREGYVDRQRVRLVAGSGVDTVRFTVTALPSAAGRSPAFLMISRLLVEKGVHEFVAAAKEIRRKYPAVTMRILGGRDPRNPSSLDAGQLATLFGSDVEWVDEVADVRPYIAAADVIVLPSYREGLPRTILEASAMGRAVITTDVPGCRQALVAEQTGLLVPAKDAKALENAMERFILDPGLISKFGKAGRQFVEQVFDERLVIDQTISDYRKLLGVGH